MAQLDRLLSVMVSNRAELLTLNENDVATLRIGGSPRPVTKQPLTSAQVVSLLREIAPEDAATSLEAGRPVQFRYVSDDGVFAVRTTVAEGRWEVTITPDGDADFQRMTGTFRAVTDTAIGAAAAGQTAAAAVREGAPRSSASIPVQAGTGESGEAAARAEMDGLLRLLVERGGSDLHLRVGEPPILRAGGEMVRLDGLKPLWNEELEALLASIMPEKNKGEFAELNDTDFAYEIEGCARFRANALRDRKGAGAVFRVIPATVVTVEQMGISQEVQNLCFLTKGLVLVTGPTGSGKSTTLCALIDLVNRSRTDHVITIEDPIEFVHPNKNCIITQRQVGVHTSSFKHALRAALREDPDIILVGELRDLETVSIAIETAETGHLVFGTLHTTTAPSTIDRVIDQFPPDRQEQIRVMLSDSLKGVVSQVLCKKIGGGRVAAREILLTVPSVSNLIREGKTFQIPSVMQTSRKIGMVTLGDALIDLVDARQVEPKEAYMKSTDKVGFVNMLRQRGHPVDFLEAEGGMAGKDAAGAKGPAPGGPPGAKPGAKPPVARR